MHNPMKCLDFLWDKYREGKLVEWGKANPMCALHKLSCIGAYGTQRFCPDEPADDDGTPLVIGSADVDAAEFRAKVAQLDCEVCGTDPEAQNVAQGPLDDFLQEALLRIVKKLMEKWFQD